MSSSERVFQIPELLENILSYLNPRDVLLSQRVSRTWANTITFSHPLQRALFFLPDWSQWQPVRSISSPTDSSTTSPSLSCSLPPKPFLPKPNILLARAWPCNYPALQEFTTPLVRKLNLYSITVDFPAHTAPTAHPSAHYDRASWRRMQLCQPPCTRLRLARATPFRLGLEAVIEDAQGITMGLLHEKAAGGAGMWDSEFVSNDGSWHFEGTVASTSWHVERNRMGYMRIRESRA